MTVEEATNLRSTMGVVLHLGHPVVGYAHIYTSAFANVSVDIGNDTRHTPAVHAALADRVLRPSSRRGLRVGLSTRSLRCHGGLGFIAAPHGG